MREALSSALVAVMIAYLGFIVIGSIIMGVVYLFE